MQEWTLRLHGKGQFRSHCVIVSLCLCLYLNTCHKPWTDNPEYARCDQNPVIPTDGKDHPTSTHQPCAQYQYPPPAQAIRDQCEKETDDHVAQQRQCHK